MTAFIFVQAGAQKYSVDRQRRIQVKSTRSGSLLVNAFDGVLAGIEKFDGILLAIADGALLYIIEEVLLGAAEKKELLPKVELTVPDVDTVVDVARIVEDDVGVAVVAGYA